MSDEIIDPRFNTRDWKTHLKIKEAMKTRPIEPAPDKAARLGLDLVRPADDELFIDLDSSEMVAEFLEKLRFFRDLYEVTSVQWTRSKGGNWHAYVRVRDVIFDRTERVALQAALGSDPAREMIAIMHLNVGYDYENVFFEKPGVAKTDVPWHLIESEKTNG